ncbi:hemin uptake protein HemP [Edwardsiella ictaluri]|uniref:hemin uptake protein HemP n=1 Tax=Edwardsiella ictaluri TaxID=67780 RepID=UPI0009BCA5F9|nr:hemin uptake protein HemP [Edwardsiella ictaluri]ARD38438.1 hemin transporter [Edwardsiella ictaluri]QPW26857.1 hemin uptake protein HemP [Edwardsiella ictaluri]
MIIIKMKSGILSCVMTMEKATPDSPRTKLTQERTSAPGSTIASHTLLGQAGRVTITHQGEYYQLRQTRAGKLILTK